MAYANPSFETADPANPGLAQSWTLTVVSFVTIAGYALGGGLERAWEDLSDGWFPGAYATDLGAMSTADYSALIFVTPPAFEAFEEGWFAGPYASSLGSVASAPYGSGLQSFDTFEVEWFTGSYATTLGSMVQGTYGSGAANFDTFETEWFTGAYATTLGSTTAAQYSGAVAYEDFSPSFAPVPFVVAPNPTNVFTAIAHGMSNGKRVRVGSTDHLPDGLGAGNYYFVISVTANTFQLSATSGGSAIVVTSPGAGTHTVITDGTTEWGLLLD